MLGRVSRQRSHTQRCAQSVDGRDFGFCPNDIRMRRQSQIVVSRDLQVVSPVDSNVWKAVGNRKLSEKDAMGRFKIVPGSFFMRTQNSSHLSNISGIVALQ